MNLTEKQITEIREHWKSNLFEDNIYNSLLLALNNHIDTNNKQKLNNEHNCSFINDYSSQIIKNYLDEKIKIAKKIKTIELQQKMLIKHLSNNYIEIEDLKKEDTNVEDIYLKFLKKIGMSDDVNNKILQIIGGDFNI